MVRVGLTDQPVSGAADLSVKKIFFHSAYYPEGLSYDIALIKLTQPLTFNGESFASWLNLEYGMVKDQETFTHDMKKFILQGILYNWSVSAVQYFTWLKSRSWFTNLQIVVGRIRCRTWWEMFTSPLSDQIEPICLPNYDEAFSSGSMCWISGWGATGTGGELLLVFQY